MTSESHDMTGFLAGPPWPTVLVTERRRRRRPARWFRAAVIVQCVILAAVFGWLIVGRPGMPSAAEHMKRTFGLSSHDAVAPAR